MGYLKKTKNAIMIAVLMVVLMTTGVFAESGWITRSEYNHTYHFRSTISHISGGVNTATEINCDSPVPEGYMVAIARLFNKRGQMLNNTRRRNAQNCTTVSTDFNFYTSEDCYSKGKVELYNGNGYTPHYCSQTPTITPYAVKEVQVNENGEIYGSDYFLSQIGVQPDLISAVGENGADGYVKRTDLEPYFNTPEELADFDQNDALHIIPLYLSDGETIIGSFVMN